MSKKIFTLATTRCGYCKMLEQLIVSQYPELDDDKFTYFLYDKDDLTPEALMVRDFAREMKVTGVPFTVMISNGEIVKAIRGYNPASLKIFVEEVLSSGSEPEQLEIEFTDN
ncbi:MAG: thioredoxin family protein [Vicingus serpentipes]|nr:thioredoxin family protein [Vicingus serpentipes]